MCEHDIVNLYRNTRKFRLDQYHLKSPYCVTPCVSYRNETIFIRVVISVRSFVFLYLIKRWRLKFCIENASNPARGVDFCLLWVLCVVRLRSLRRADPSSRGVLPTVWCVWVWWWSLDNEGSPGPLWAVAPWEENRECTISPEDNSVLGYDTVD
jgi:hypothetical protein